MNRRKPRIDVAVVPAEEGEDAGRAVLRKVCRSAVDAAVSQSDGAIALLPFIAGYLAGHARQQALKHGLDAESDGCVELIAVLEAAAPDDLKAAIAALRFAPREAVSGRAGLRAGAPLADAGYIVGHLEALCGTRRLLAMGLKLGGAAGIDPYLTACDVAADRMQTHHPTAALRLDPDERAVLRQAFASA